MPLPWQREKDLEELEEIEHKKGVQLSIAQKEMAIKKLKEHGLKPKMFSSWSAIVAWVKNH